MREGEGGKTSSRFFFSVFFSINPKGPWSDLLVATPTSWEAVWKEGDKYFREEERIECMSLSLYLSDLLRLNCAEVWMIEGEARWLCVKEKDK